MDFDGFLELAQLFHLKYLQGPRYHIAVVLMWRQKVSEHQLLCRQKGNALFFDSNQTPAAQKAAHNGLLSSGWKPIQQSNFRIPQNEIFDPCLSKRVRDLFGWS